MLRVYTSGQVAKFLRVAPRTANKYFEKGYFSGYRLPDSLDRRILGDSLRAFMEERGIPTDLLDEHERKTSPEPVDRR